MELNLLDRIVILETLLPETGTIEEIKQIISIKEKLKLTTKEKDAVKMTYDQHNIMSIDTENEEILVSTIGLYDITLEELNLLSTLAENLNRSGYVTISSLSTIEKLINYTID